MAFIEKYKSNNQKINIVRPEELSALYSNTFRCPYCYIVPAFNLNLDLDTLLIVKVTCKCGEKEFEINDFLSIYSKDFRGNLQCYACKEFATKNNTVFKYCLGCCNFFCAECQYDHMVKEENTFIDFRDVGSICKEHKIYYQAYCKKCQENICKYCYQDHAGHKVVNYNTLYISDLEMVDLNKNYGKVQLTVLFKDTETKEIIHNLLKDVDELNKNYITELFDANKQKNQYILQYFKVLLTLYNNTVHKTYNVIMNIRNNICYNTTSLEIRPDTKMDDNTLLNKFYLYAKNHCIAKKPKPFKEKYEKIDTSKNMTVKSEMDDDYQEIIENINPYLKIINIDNYSLKDNVEVQIQTPFKYESYIYFGEYRVDNNIPHGRGILIYKNGDKYYGNFENGKKSKIGIFYFKNKNAKYKGEWENNKMNGYGIYHYPNGTIYEGYFKDNKRHGFGILTTSKGDIYKTIWNEGNVSDYGKIYYHDGKLYEGYIKNYKKDVCGTLYYPNGDRYRGVFAEDNFVLGHYRYKNGNSYYGYYSKNKKNGYGKYKYITNGEVYEGYFVNDKKQGIGRYFYSNGDIYTGYLFDDLRNGFGIIKFNNGDWYQGMFVKDIRHGIGIYYEKKGDEYYLGEWVEDKKEGVATIYNQNWYYNGSVKNGIKDGYCTFIFEDNIYTGPFKDNMWEGYGTLIMSKESQIYTGLFIKGKMPPSVTKKSISDDFEELKL